LYHVEQKKFEKLSIEGPKARKDHSAVFIGKTMYIFGGRDNENEALDDFWSFNIESKVWEKHDQDKIANRYNHSSAALGPNVWIFGGRADDGKIFDDVWKFSTESKTWESIATTGESKPGKRFNMCSLVSNGRIILVGGQENIEAKNYSKDMFSLNPDTKVWKHLGQIPCSARVGNMVSPGDNELLLYGGRTEKETENDVWLLPLQTYKWERHHGWEKINAPVPKPRSNGTANQVRGKGRKFTLIGGAVFNEKGYVENVFGDVWTFYALMANPTLRSPKP